jgi:ferredoxin
VAVKVLRTKLIMFGLYENMTEGEINIMLDITKLQPISKPSTRIDFVVWKALQFAHKHSDSYRKANSIKCLQNLAKRELIDESIKESLESWKEIYNNQTYNQEQAEGINREFSDRYINISQYILEILRRFEQNGTLTQKETAKYVQAMRTTYKSRVKKDDCSACKTCVDICPVNARSIKIDTNHVVVDSSTCIGCRQCEDACPEDAIRISRINNLPTVAKRAKQIVKGFICGIFTTDGKQWQYTNKSGEIKILAHGESADKYPIYAIYEKLIKTRGFTEELKRIDKNFDEALNSNNFTLDNYEIFKKHFKIEYKQTTELRNTNKNIKQRHLMKEIHEFIKGDLCLKK